MTDNPHHEKRWLILGVIAIAQLMVVLDATIVNIALPSAQTDLGFSNDSRQWIITAYASVHGYTVAFWVSAGVFAVGALIVGTVMRPIKVAAEEPVGQPVAA